MPSPINPALSHELPALTAAQTVDGLGVVVVVVVVVVDVVGPGPSPEPLALTQEGGSLYWVAYNQYPALDVPPL